MFVIKNIFLLFEIHAHTVRHLNGISYFVGLQESKS